MRVLELGVRTQIYKVVSPGSVCSLHVAVELEHLQTLKIIQSGLT